jgi:HlyD family secretion protein
MKRSLIIAGIVVVIAVIAMILIGKATAKKDLSTLYATAEKGQFEILVTTTGELQAEFSTDIKGPEMTQSRNIRSMDIKIQDLIPEGTEVKEGDFVASLDKTTFDNSLKDELERLETQNTAYQMKLLDSAVTLSNYRDNIKNQVFTVEEADITLQQSKYEPPTTQRQAEINLDKAKRTLDQLLRSYDLRLQQSISDIRNQEQDIRDQQQRVKDLQDVLAKFTITAPSSGMVIYKKDRSGTKRKIGSSISPWDPVVATLPDLKSMISKTYVNEIDVSKVKAGQKVSIVVDAFPERSYTGSVISVANIGEQLPNADAKVFEVQIKVDGSDPILRPSMTTGNKVITKTIEDVVFIPLECVQTGEDSVPVIYLKNNTKHIVVLGESNENNVIVEQGIEPGNIIYLSTPENPESFKLVGEELKAVIKEREQARKDEEIRIRKEAEKALEERSKMMEFGGGQMQQFQNMRGGNNQRGGASQTGQQRTGNAQMGQMGGGAAQFGQAGGQMNGQMSGQMGGQRSGTRDTAAMRRRMMQGGQQGGVRDTAAMRRFRNMQQQGGQQGTRRDTTARRRTNTQGNQQENQPAENSAFQPVFN